MGMKVTFTVCMKASLSAHCIWLRGRWGVWMSFTAIYLAFSWHHQSITNVLRKSQQKGCWLNQPLTPFKVLMGWEYTGSWMHNVCISFPEHSVNFIRFGSTGENLTGCCRDMNVSDWLLVFCLFQYHVYNLRQCGLVLSCLSLLQAAGRRIRQAPLGKGSGSREMILRPCSDHWAIAYVSYGKMDHGDS